jgi:anti-anti-sigma factor
MVLATGKDPRMATLDLAEAGRQLPPSREVAVIDGAAVLARPELLATLQRKGLRLSAQARSSGQLVLRLEGKLVAATAPLLKQAVAAGGRACHLDLDLASLTHADGVGLAVLVRLASIVAEAGGSLRLINPTPALRTMMTRVNLHHLIEIAEPAPGDEPPARP